MADSKLIRGWMVCGAGEGDPAREKYFLDVNNAMTYCEQHRNGGSLYIQQQYIRPEWAEDLHQSRLRRQSGRER